jgi:hypothetical protein
MTEMAGRLSFRTIGAGLGLLLLGTAITVASAAAAPRARVVTSTTAKLHFPVRCGTVLTPRDISKIVKRTVITGRSSDVDPHTTLCYYGTFPHSTDDLSVTVDAFSPAYLALQAGYPVHKVKALGAFGNRIAEVNSSQDDEVIAFYGSWYLAVKGYADGATMAYTPSQVMALAQLAYANVTSRRTGGH